MIHTSVFTYSGTAVSQLRGIPQIMRGGGIRTEGAVRHCDDAYDDHNEVLCEFCCPSNIEVVQEFTDKTICEQNIPKRS